MGRRPTGSDSTTTIAPRSAASVIGGRPTRYQPATPAIGSRAATGPANRIAKRRKTPASAPSAAAAIADAAAGSAAPASLSPRPP
jgi:hypothetical protein